MVVAIIEFCIKNRFMTIIFFALAMVWGVYCLYNTPVDAIPDLSENQQIIFTDWLGRSPQDVEDQITYPLSVNLSGLAGVKAVRSISDLWFFGWFFSLEGREKGGARPPPPLFPPRGPPPPAPRLLRGGGRFLKDKKKAEVG